MIEVSTDDSGSLSEPVIGSDVEREPNSDFKLGGESVFDFDPRVGFGFWVQDNQSQFLYIVVLEEK